MESGFGAAEGVLRKRYSLGGRSYKMSRMEKGDNRILELFQILKMSLELVLF